MKIQTYKRGDVICRQGDPGDCMYDIQGGKVGIFFDYGGPREEKLAELYSDQVFGELGLLDHAARSATAVALTDDTYVDVITEDNFMEFFEKNPPKMLMVMQQMCSRLRRTTRDYVEACQTVRQASEAGAAGAEDSGVKKHFRKFAEMYRNLFKK